MRSIQQEDIKIIDVNSPILKDGIYKALKGEIISNTIRMGTSASFFQHGTDN